MTALRGTHAVMLVHSYSQTHAWFEDYAAFAGLYGQKAEVDTLVYAGEVGGRHLYLGWVVGEGSFWRGDSVHLRRMLN